VYGYNGDDPGGGQVLQPSLADAIPRLHLGRDSAPRTSTPSSNLQGLLPRGERPLPRPARHTAAGDPMSPRWRAAPVLRGAVASFTVTGAEVLDLLPTGYGIVLDLEGETRVVFDAQAIEQMIDYTMKRMYG